MSRSGLQAYVKLIDYGEKVITNKIRGFLLMQIVKYLSHVHPHPQNSSDLCEDFSLVFV